MSSVLGGVFKYKEKNLGVLYVWGEEEAHVW
jgi:hypothetical protein